MIRVGGCYRCRCGLTYDAPRHRITPHSLRDLAALPGNRLEALRGDREGHYSIRINRQWRICFRWQAGDALDVEIVDYH